MKTVSIEVDTLQAAIKDNRIKHIKEYNEAVIGYKVSAEKKLKSMIKDLRAGKPIGHSLNLIAPMSMVADYDRAIKMLEMTANKVVEISEQEFSQYVMDDWSWKSQFKMFTDTYNGAK